MTRRADRLGEEIREEVAQMITAELKDPRIGFVTVTRVALGPDLRLARIFVGVLGTEKQRQTSLTGLKQASGFLRRALGQRLRLRHTPELLFQYDEGLQASDRVAKLLDEIRTPAADAPEPASDDHDDVDDE
ncbi:MAG TPA: 30S ribosome-binding factor RbfA [Vicinamibacteria bacterium]|nr:30S ribosome-binding factor RbfA [Vicinamibacteria bacterium]